MFICVYSVFTENCRFVLVEESVNLKENFCQCISKNADSMCRKIVCLQRFFANSNVKWMLVKMMLEQQDLKQTFH